MTKVRACLVETCIYNEDLACILEEVVVDALASCQMWDDVNRRDIKARIRDCLVKKGGE
jgi:hypothetical protein